jgi:hypothetical protein
MRIALYLLLLANLSYLAWSQWIDVPEAPVRSAPSSLKPLLLAAEAYAPAPPRTVSSAAPSAGREATSGPPVAAAPRCVSIGPFDDEGSARHGTEELRRRGLSARLRLQPGMPGHGFWVHIGGLDSGAVAADALRSLTASGLTGATLTQVSAAELRISLGLYTDADEANRRLQEARRLKLRASLAERRLSAHEHWLDVTLPPGDPVPIEDLHPYPNGPLAKVGAQPCPGDALLGAR